MSGWMIGLSLTGAFAGAVAGWVRELTHDWNGGTVKSGAGWRFARATAAGAVVGLGLGWVMTDSKTKEESAIEDCYKKAPAGGTVNITRTADGVKCSYKP